MELISRFADVSGWVIITVAALLVLLDIFVTATEVFLWIAAALAVSSLAHFAGLEPAGMLVTYTLAFAAAAGAIAIRQKNIARHRFSGSGLGGVPKIGDVGTLIVPEYPTTSGADFHDDPRRKLLIEKKEAAPEGGDWTQLQLKCQMADGSVWPAHLADGYIPRTGSRAEVVSLRGYELNVRLVSPDQNNIQERQE